jgi:hypothetical protein
MQFPVPLSLCGHILEAQDDMVTCFPENVAGESFTSALYQHLGSRARQFLSQYRHAANHALQTRPSRCGCNRGPS